MKKTIFAVCALTIHMCWLALQPVSPSAPFPGRKTQVPVPATLAEKMPIAETLPVANPNESQLREELAQIDHELARAGYPEVLLDERLSEAEREELISKVLRSTELYDRIVRMRVAAIQRNAR